MSWYSVYPIVSGKGRNWYFYILQKLYTKSSIENKQTKNLNVNLYHFDWHKVIQTSRALATKIRCTWKVGQAFFYTSTFFGRCVVKIYFAAPRWGIYEFTWKLVGRILFCMYNFVIFTDNINFPVLNLQLETMCHSFWLQTKRLWARFTLKEMNYFMQ